MSKEKLTGHDAYKARLASGESIIRRERGNSMEPSIHSGGPSSTSR